MAQMRADLVRAKQVLAEQGVVLHVIRLMTKSVDDTKAVAATLAELRAPG